MEEKIIINNYFLHIIDKEYKKRNKFILWRKKAKQKRLDLFLYFIRGDIINLNIWIHRFIFHFEGICLSVKYKNFFNINTSISLRNVIDKIGIDVNISFYYNRLFKRGFLVEYKRKFLWYKAAKLGFLRNKKNQNTRIL